SAPKFPQPYRRTCPALLICGYATTLWEGIMKTSLRKAATPQRRSAPRGNTRGNNRRQPARPFAAQQPRRRFLHLAAGAATLAAVSKIARAQTYPTRPVRIIA